MDNKNPKQSFAEAKRASIAQTLMKCARLMNEEGVARFRNSVASPKLRGVHMSVMPHIDLEGTRLTTLAQRMGVSKQAAGQLIDELCDFGLIEKIPDPSDGRAKLLRVVGGGNAMMAGLAVLGEIEQEFVQSIGKKRMREFHRTLLDMLEIMETEWLQ